MGNFLLEHVKGVENAIPADKGGDTLDKEVNDGFALIGHGYRGGRLIH